MKHPIIRMTLSTLVAIALTGCAGTGPHTAHSTRPAEINHIVFIKLKNPADVPALIADSDRLLPGVTRYACGQHIDTGRATVIHDYDVGLYIGFDSTADYAVYVDHPDHKALVAEWRPKSEWLHVYDVLDETP
jgi:hypothetical protein